MLKTIQGEHKNTPWFQIVIKSKLAGIFIQNWWLQLQKLIVSCGITHTQCAPLLLLGKHRCDNLASSDQTLGSISSVTELTAAVMPECPFLWSQMHPLLMKFLCHLKMDSLVGGSTLNLRLKACCTVTALFVVWNSSTHQPRCFEVSAILNFTALWRRAGKLKISWVNVTAVPYLWKYSSRFWFYNYLKSRSVFVFALYN